MVIASGSHEQAGGLLLLAAATETGLLTRFEQALPPSPDPPCFPLAGSPAIRRRLLLTLLFLGAVGLQRIWDLRGYAADGLALLTGRKCKSQLSRYCWRTLEGSIQESEHLIG